MKNCNNCIHKDVCYAKGSMYERAETCSKYLSITDVKPTRHGHWEPIVNYFKGEPDGRYWCSECRRVVNKYETYCPACGAYMLKESKANE